jgi:chaperonin GroEL
MVAKAVRMAGKYGSITVGESRTLESNLEVTQGMQFASGYLSRYFVTDAQSMQCVLENAFILVYEQRIGSVPDLLPLMERIAKVGKPLLIIAEDVEGEALTTLVVNKLRNSLQVCAVKAPGSGTQRKFLLEDLAIVTGATAIHKDLGLSLTDVQLNHLGQAGKVMVTRETTMLIDGHGEKGAIDVRVRHLQKQLERAHGSYDYEKLQERLSKLTGGVAVIKIGAATETEMKEKKARAEDSLRATRAAIEEGIIAGGGVAFINCIPVLDRLRVPREEAAGVRVVQLALEAPLRQIAENTGEDSGAVVNRVRESEDRNFGFNAASAEYTNMVLAGVIDPVKVTRLALQNAASIAAAMLTVGALVAEPMSEVRSPQVDKSEALGSMF